jgi:hypothetical protein
MSARTIHPDRFLNWDAILKNGEGYRRIRLYNRDPVAYVTALRRLEAHYPGYEVRDLNPSPVQAEDVRGSSDQRTQELLPTNPYNLPAEMADRHHMDPEDPDTPEAIGDAIRSGMLQWDPGSLTSRQLEQVLTDALADLWRDCYRRGNRDYQRTQFLQRVRLYARNALGQEGVL